MSASLDRCIPFSRAWISNARAAAYAATSSSPVIERAASVDWTARVRASNVFARFLDAPVDPWGPEALKGFLLARLKAMVAADGGAVVEHEFGLKKLSGLARH